MAHAQHAHGHGEAHGHGSAPGGPAVSVPLLRALTITVIVAVAEVIGGVMANSIALLADAGHMATDVAALSLALFAAWLGRRPARPAQTFGPRRWEVLAAWVNGAALVAISGGILWEGVARLGSPEPVAGGLMLGVAIVGLVTNAVSAWWLHHAAHTNLNVRGAYLHVLGDLAGSGATIVAALCVVFANWTIADPIASIGVALLVLFSAGRLMREATNVLLEGAPAHIDLAGVRATLEGLPGVGSVHDLHVWTVGGGVVAMSAHAVMVQEDVAQGVLESARSAMARFGIGHVTIQIERPELEGCGDCEPLAAKPT